MAEQTPQGLYDEFYYATGLGLPYRRDEHWVGFFAKIAEALVAQIGPRSVLDAGCALGLLVEQLRLRGVDAEGVDISEYAIANAPEAARPFVRVGSVAAPFGRRYDLIVCIEVLEHMPPAEAEATVANLCAHSDDVLFSSSPLDFKEATHFNVRPIEHWAELFARHGFVRDVDFDASFLTPWATRFRHSAEPAHRQIRNYERRFWELWKANTDLRELALEQRELAQRLDRQARLAATQYELLHSVSLLDRQSLPNISWEEVDSMREYAARLEEELANRDRYIGWLEDLIRTVEGGRMMTAMRRLRRSGTLLPPRPGDPPPRSLAATVVARLSAALRGQPRRRAPAAPPAEPPPPPPPPPDPYARWIAASEPTPAELEAQRAEARRLPVRALISLVTPVFNPPPAALEAMLASVTAQTYDRWELCLADGSDWPEIAPILARAAAADPRIRVRPLARNEGISANSNAALDLAGGEFVLLLDHDDTLAPNALFAVAQLIAERPDVDIVYFDEDKLSEDGARRHSPWFKPAGRSPDLMLATNYLMHGAFRRELVEAVGRFDPATDGAQDWDLALRCFERTAKLDHIPQVLYHWRQVPGSAARDANAKPWALAGQERALRGHLDRTGAHGAEVRRLSPSELRVVWPTGGRLVSIIIPTRDRPELIRACLRSILSTTAYPSYEVVLVDGGSTDPRTLALYEELRGEGRVRLVRYEGEFNYSRANNLGAAHARGDLLLFLNNDTEVRAADWLDELAGWAGRPEVGVVGCRLVRPDGTTQHAGIALGVEGHGSHLFDGDMTPAYGPFGSSEWYRDLMAVTGACLMTRRDVFEALGGFDERYRVGYSDITFCVAAHERGLRVVYTPWATLLHHEGASRGFELPAADVVRATVALLPLVAAGDPYFSPNLSPVHRWPTVADPDGEAWHQRMARILAGFQLLRFDDPAHIRAAEMRLRAPQPTRTPLDGRAPRLLLCSHDLSQTGAPLILFQLARQLIARGYEVTIASPADGPLAGPMMAAGVSVQVVLGSYDSAIEAALLVRGYDMVLVNTVLGWRAVLAAYAEGVPCAWWVHESRFGRELMAQEPAARQAFALADELIFPVEATARRYADLPRQGPSARIPYGLLELDPQPGPCLPRDGRVPVVILASIEPRKGQDVVLEALEQIPGRLREQLDLYLVGAVLDWPYYRKLRAHRPAGEMISFAGMLAHGQALSYVAQAEIFLLPSRDEVLPISLLEAMAFGKAILATDVGGVAEAARHGQEALVVPAGDPRALADALATLLGAPDMRARLGAAARARYEERFTGTAFADAMETVFRRLLGSTGLA